MQSPSDGRSGSIDPAARPTRRTFTAEYKARVVAEYEAAPHGEKSAVLRREGLFHSHVREWAATRDVGALAGLDRASSASERRQRRSEQAEIDRLRAENQRLTGKLAQTQAALSIMGKAHELLESLAESSEPPSGSNR
jgi:transposase-like protein